MDLKLLCYSIEASVKQIQDCLSIFFLKVLLTVDVETI